jgi:hypothetical protein
MWTNAARDAYNGYAEVRNWAFTHFQNIEGYVARPLTAIWLLAPYLHNGSVPTLWDLLTPPQDRRATFYVGYDGYDFARMGFDTETADARRAGQLFDTHLAGNSNQGHTYGTELSVNDRRALIEYLKTL